MNSITWTTGRVGNLIWKIPETFLKENYESALPSLPLEPLVGFSGVTKRPVRGSTGRVSRGPPLRAIATIGGGGSTPALKRIRCTGSEGWAPTESQYLDGWGRDEKKWLVWKIRLSSLWIWDEYYHSKTAKLMQQNNLNSPISANSNSFWNIRKKEKGRKESKGPTELRGIKEVGNLKLIGSKPQRNERPNSKC